MAENIRVVVVDDHPLFRQGVVHALTATDDISVIGEADSGTEALAIVRDQLPDVVLLDINMPGWSGLVTTEKISAECPSTAIIVLTSSEDKDTLFEAFKAGAKAYVLKGVSSQELGQVIRTVANGDAYISPSLATHMLLSMKRQARMNPLDELTGREHQILSMIGSGMKNREIGEALTLAEKTIKRSVTNILQKLHVRNRVEAALLAARHDGSKVEYSTLEKKRNSASRYVGNPLF
jgi:two-component system nitrate/nitrite response regulator NarL